MARTIESTNGTRYAYEITNTSYLRHDYQCIRCNTWSWSRESISSIGQTEISKSRRYIKYLQKFLKEFEIVKSEFAGFDEHDLKRKIEKSLSTFVTLKANTMAVGLTNDRTFQFTIKKNDYSFYIDQLLENLAVDENEFQMTVFKKNKMVKSENVDMGGLVKRINEVDFN